MCMCGCEYENGCGDCSINYNYCEYERLDRIKELKGEVTVLTRAIELAKKESDTATAEELRLWIQDLKDTMEEIKNIETEEEKEYRLEREEEQRER